MDHYCWKPKATELVKVIMTTSLGRTVIKFNRFINSDHSVFFSACKFIKF